MAITKIQSESLNLSDNYDFTGTVTGAGENNTPMFFATKTTDQTGLTNDADIKFQGSVEDFDIGGCYNSTGSTVTLNGISTPAYSFAPNVAGIYLLHGSILPTASNSGETRESVIRFFKNNSGINFLESTSNYPTYSHRKLRVTGSVVVQANGTTDYFHMTCRLVANSGFILQCANKASYFGGHLLTRT